MTATIKPKDISEDYLSHFFLPALFKEKPYRIDTPQVKIKLDQNECPWDWPETFKNKVLRELKEKSWNRYPSAFADDLQNALAHYCQIHPDCLITSVGSNHLLTLILNAFTKRCRGKIVIPRPSFQLYESHCLNEDTAYELWPLNADLEYNLKSLPTLPDYSLIIFASPNNPVGNILPKKTFETLLNQYPQCFFIADEAYYEFVDEPYTDLLTKYNNFISVRTFSKTLGAAGVRLGYALGAKNTITQLKKLRLPYLLNHFTLIAAKALLSEPELHAHTLESLKIVKHQRQKMYEELQNISARTGDFLVKPSHANFMLLRWPHNEAAQHIYKKLIEASILVRDVSRSPGLTGCLRVSVGQEQENEVFIRVMKSCY